ncbi:outer membrane protein [Pigmentibacter ruber]
MKRNALISLAGSLVVANFAFAQENSKIGLDVLAGAGYTHYNGMKSEEFDKSNVSANGFNLNATALYSVMKTELGSPVVGLGINYTQVQSSTELARSGAASVTYKEDFKTLALMANAGYKFTLTPKFNLFALANFGYGVYNDNDGDLTFANGSLSASLKSNEGDIKTKDHFIYGVTLAGTYEIAESFSLGLGATYNRHQAKREFGDNNYNINFNEFSTNLIASYSF